MSFSAGKRLDVIITIMKTVQCYVSYTPDMQKVEGPKLFFQSRGAVPAGVKLWK